MISAIGATIWMWQFSNIPIHFCVYISTAFCCCVSKGKNLNWNTNYRMSIICELFHFIHGTLSAVIWKTFYWNILRLVMRGLICTHPQWCNNTYYFIVIQTIPICWAHPTIIRHCGFMEPLWITEILHSICGRHKWLYQHKTKRRNCTWMSYYQ